MSFRFARDLTWICALSCMMLAPARITLADVDARPHKHERPIASPDFEIVRDAAERLGLSEVEVQPLELPEGLPDSFRVQLDAAGERWTLDLQRTSVRSPDFQVLTGEDSGWAAAAPEPVRTYQGSIREFPGAVAAVTLLDEGMQGVILMPDDRRIFIEPLATKLAGADWADHAIFEDRAQSPDGSTCETPKTLNRVVPRESDRSGTVGGCGGDACIAQLACDSDVEFNLIYGAGTLARIESIVNAINVQYKRDVGIVYELTTVLIRTGDINSDPYSSSDAPTLLNQFQAHWNASQGAIQRDVAQLFTGRDLDGTTVGYANPGTICGGQAYSVVQDRPTFSRATDLSAHELGHNWSADHCSCAGDETTGYTMNASLTGANRFHPTFTIPEIIAFRNTLACLDALEGGTTTMPLTDTFEAAAPSPVLWTGNDGAETSTLATNEPSPTRSLRINGADVIRSARIDTNLYINITLSYFVQRGGTADPPEATDHLFVDFCDASGNWVNIADHAGTGASQSTFVMHSHQLPVSAEHSALRIRFRGASPQPGLDDWFIDNVSLTGTPALPGAPTLVTPPSGQVNVVLSPFFDWSSAPDAFSYRLLVDNDANFSSPAVDVTTAQTEHQTMGSPLSVATLYRWKVIAMNDNGQTESSVFTFTTSGTAPGAFQLLSPAPSGTTVATTTPTLVWQKSSGAASYRILVDRFFDFAAPLVDQTIPAPATGTTVSFVVPSGVLQTGRLYYWRVNAINPLGSTISTPNFLSFNVAGTPNCSGDADDSGAVDVNDISYVIFRLGLTPPADAGADVDGSGAVDVNDISFVVFRLGTCQ